jgi:hypothetical protein
LTERSTSRPVPGPPRSDSSAPPPAAAAPVPPSDPEDQSVGPTDERFAGLEQRPVAEHVAAFEAEHARLQHELSTIDEL